MKGKDYFNWFTEEEKYKWLDNFHEQGIQNDLNVYMEREFPKYYVFFFLGFDVHKSKEGHDYWLGIFKKNRKFDNLVVRPEFKTFSLYKQPKIL
jgi:hypothetical protein